MSYDDRKCKNCEFFRVVKEGRRSSYICKKYRIETNSIGLCGSFERRKEYKNEHIRSYN